MSAETFTHITFLQYFIFAIFSIFSKTIKSTQTKFKIWNIVVISVLFSVVSWICIICNRKISNISKIDHFVKKSHVKMLIFKSSIDLILPHVNFSTSKIFKANKTKNKMQNQIYSIIICCRIELINFVISLLFYSKKHYIFASISISNFWSTMIFWTNSLTSIVFFIVTSSHCRGADMGGCAILISGLRMMGEGDRKVNAFHDRMTTLHLTKQSIQHASIWRKEKEKKKDSFFYLR